MIVANGDHVAPAAPTLTAPTFLHWLKRRRRLRPLLQEALAESLLLVHARATGLTVNDADLQSAADRFRYRNGFTTAEQTHRWLSQEGLTIEDFEASLERELIVAKFK